MRHGWPTRGIVGSGAERCGPPLVFLPRKSPALSRGAVPTCGLSRLGFGGRQQLRERTCQTSTEQQHHRIVGMTEWRAWRAEILTILLIGLAHSARNTTRLIFYLASVKIQEITKGGVPPYMHGSNHLVLLLSRSNECELASKGYGYK